MEPAEKKRFRIWTAATMGALALLLAGSAFGVAWADPYFHFHGPEKGVSYFFGDESFINPGMASHFDYDAIITGSSLSSNFKTTDADSILGVKSIKPVFRDGRPADFSDMLTVAFRDRPGIKTVVWGIDPHVWCRTTTTEHRAPDHPGWLYDKNPFNDLPYLFNKDVLRIYSLGFASRSLRGEPAESLDSYTYWGDEFEFSRSAALSHYWRPEKADTQKPRSYYFAAVEDQFEQNMERLLRDNPQTEFILTCSPYSLLFWDMLERQGDLEAVIAGYFHLISLALEYPNARFFFFPGDTAFISDLDRYTDTMHFEPAYNRVLLEYIAAGEYELTGKELDAACGDFLASMLAEDFDSLFAK